VRLCAGGEGVPSVDDQDDPVAAAVKVISAALPVAATWTEWPAELLGILGDLTGINSATDVLPFEETP